MTCTHLTSWSEPMLCQCGCGHSVIRFRINGVDMGSVYCSNMDEGPYYPLTQIRRFGGFLNLDAAKAMVEDHAAYDAYTYPTLGNA